MNCRSSYANVRRFVCECGFTKFFFVRLTIFFSFSIVVSNILFTDRNALNINNLTVFTGAVVVVGVCRFVLCCVVLCITHIV